MEIGVNFNGDQAFELLARGASLSERIGYSHIWVGESIHFKHPFPVIAAIAHATQNIFIGSGIISYYFNRSLHIKKAFETLVEAHGERFSIALAPGDLNTLREKGIDIRAPLEKLRETVKDIRSSKKLRRTRLYIGASGPKMIELGSEIGDGVLLNYAYPDYVEWALRHLKKDTYVGVYAPALMVPDKDHEKAGLMAAAFVAAGSNPDFQKEFELRDDVNKIRRILSSKKYGDLSLKRDLLFKRFLIQGTKAEILNRIKEFREMGVDQVILGSPFTYSLKAVESIGRAL